MIVLALVLLLLVVLVTVSTVWAGDGTATLNLVGADVVTSERILFGIGAACMLVVLFALWMLVKGLRRARHRRSEMKRLRAAVPPPSTPGAGTTSMRSQSTEPRSTGSQSTGSHSTGSPATGPDAHFESTPRD